MEIMYRRTAEGSYMLIEGENRSVGYESNMLKENDVQSLLPFHTLELNGRTQFWYSISGMRSFRDIILTEGVSLDMLHCLFCAMADALRMLSKYLIDEEHLLMTPDAIFFSRKGEGYTAGLCYCPVPHEDSCEQLLSLMRFVIGEVDHSKSDITAFCYELNSIAERDSFSFYDLMERIDEEYDSTSQDRRIEAAGIDFSMYRQEDTPEVVPDDEPKIIPEACEEEKKLFDRVRAKIIGMLPKVMTGREKLLPEKKAFCDIQFDDTPTYDGATVLLSEDKSGCRGRLLYESGGRGCDDMEITKNPFAIGSKTGGNDGVIHSDTVSRYHARIFKQDGAFFLMDLNSKNGTFLNGEMLAYNEPHRLKSMDMISFADVVYRMV